MNRPSEVEFLIKRYLEGAYGLGTNEAILLMYILDSEKSRMTEQKARELVDLYKFRNLERGYVLFDFDVVRLLTEHGRGDEWKERLIENLKSLDRIVPQKPNAITWEAGVEILNFVQDFVIPSFHDYISAPPAIEKGKP